MIFDSQKAKVVETIIPEKNFRKDIWIIISLLSAHKSFLS